MKYLIPTLALLTAFSWSSPAFSHDRPEHKVEIDATLGYRFGGARGVDLEDDDGDIVPGRVTVDGSPAWGALLSYRFQHNGNVFFSYSRQVSTFRFRPDDLISAEEPDLQADGSIEYFQFGGNLQAESGVMYPYLGASIGLGRFAATEGGEGARVKFTAALDAGIRFEILPLFDLRILGRVPFTFTSSEFYCYSGRGCAIVVTDGPFVQGEVHVGAGLRF